MAPSEEQQSLLSNILASMRIMCCAQPLPLHPNLTDIEDFLEEIDDSVNIVRTLTTLQPRSLLITQRHQEQFSEEFHLHLKCQDYKNS